ncbi:hypothetical protein [Acidiferrobacter sp.]|uniref:hypothetical protein n=1 Tax=Acidiferrobacter sp. TaxID=1872107 RepID=UPI00261E028B|nr:hypothetical protein [Acidiferrobacter sp.]
MTRPRPDLPVREVGGGVAAFGPSVSDVGAALPWQGAAPGWGRRNVERQARPWTGLTQ